MDGNKLKQYLTSKGILNADAAKLLGVSRQTFQTWLSKATFNEKQQNDLIEKLSLPNDFFLGTNIALGEGNVQYHNSSSAALAECEKSLAVYQERVAQLELRIKEKDQIITLLTKTKK